MLTSPAAAVAAALLSAARASTTAKLEVTTHARWNPIRQDVHADGSARFYPLPLPRSYGMLPRTLESPSLRERVTQLLGDGDPLDAIDLTPPAATTGGPDPPPGSILIRRVVGALGMVDKGALDWKVLLLHPDHAVKGEAGCGGTAGAHLSTPPLRPFLPYEW